MRKNPPLKPATENNNFLVLARATTDQSSIDDRGAVKTVETALKYIQVAPDQLETQVNDFLKKAQKLLTTMPTLFGEFSLDEVELAVEITGEGTVAFLGTGGKLSGTGGITFNFKRTRS